MKSRLFLCSAGNGIIPSLSLLGPYPFPGQLSDAIERDFLAANADCQFLAESFSVKRFILSHFGFAFRRHKKTEETEGVQVCAGEQRGKRKNTHTHTQIEKDSPRSIENRNCTGTATLVTGAVE